MNVTAFRFWTRLVGLVITDEQQLVINECYGGPPIFDFATNRQKHLFF